MFVTSLIATLIMIQAPSDVPKEHWAFPAVDALFREGLLKGYPPGKSAVLSLDKSIKQDLQKASKVLTVWKAESLLVGYPDHHGHRRPASNYELAVAVHAAWFNAQELVKGEKTSNEQRRWIYEQLPTMAKLVSMFEPELTKLGANPIDMMAVINDLNDSSNRLFHGNR